MTDVPLLVPLVPHALARCHREDLPVGTRLVSQRRTLAEADVVAFARISDDFNPLHVDETISAAGPFSRNLGSSATQLRS